MNPARILPLVIFLCLPLASQSGRLQPTRPTLLQGMAPDTAEINMRRTPIVRAVEMAEDSVVSIYVQDSNARAGSSGIEGQGSGVIIDASGLVITNWHVIASVDINPSGRELVTKLKNKKSYEARLLSSSRENDLALLQLILPAEELVKPLQSSDSDTLMVGETVIAIGNPQGHANTVTVGVLSALDRAINVRTPDRKVRRYRGLLQTDAAINQGNSGGALIDITGRLIGINNAMAMGAENIGFAIPVNTVRRVFEDVLLSSDNMTSLWLGMEVKDRGEYALVTDLTPSGPAAREGLRRGDRLLNAGGEPVTSAIDFARSLARARIGSPFPVEIQRSGRRLRMEPKPLSRAEAKLVERIGLEFEEITREDDEELLKEISLKFSEELRRRPRWLPLALRVTQVYEGGSGEETGMEVGDMLVALIENSFFTSDRPIEIRSIENLSQMVGTAVGEEIEVLLMRGKDFYKGPIEVR